MSSGFMHGGGHHGGGHHGGHHHSSHTSHGDGSSVLSHSGANTPGHHSILAQLLGINQHHHIMHAQSTNPHGLPLGVLPGFRFGLLLEGVKLSPGFLYFILFSFLIGYLFFIHWLRHHDPLAKQVIQIHNQASINPLDSSIVSGIQEAYPIKNQSGGTTIYTPGSDAVGQIASPVFNLTHNHKAQTQSFGNQAFNFNRPSSRLNSYTNQPALSQPNPAFGQPEVTPSTTQATFQYHSKNNIDSFPGHAFNSDGNAYGTTDHSLQPSQNPLMINNSIENQFNFRNNNNNSLYARQNTVYNPNFTKYQSIVNR